MFSASPFDSTDNTYREPLIILDITKTESKMFYYTLFGRKQQLYNTSQITQFDIVLGNNVLRTQTTDN